MEKIYILPGILKIQYYDVILHSYYSVLSVRKGVGAGESVLEG